jgi:hypothetical protein
MKTLISIFFICLTACYTECQEILSHHMTANIDVPHRIIRVRDSMNVDFRGRDSLSFVLWKNTLIHSISLGHAQLPYSFDTSSQSPIMYIPNGGRLLIVRTNQDSGTQFISLDYECNMKNLQGWAKSFSDSWIELNFYSAWFPVCTTSGNFTSEIAISIDSAYVVSGSGIVSRPNDSWEMVQPWHSYDNVIIASANLKKKVLQSRGAYIEADYFDFPESAADSVISECGYALALYEKLFGTKDTTYLKFIIAPFEKGGGYSRKNFVSMGTKQFNLYTQAGIGHELAHFWWKNASAATWEDWLNEGFAEYSMLVYFRERLGKDVFLKRVGEYKIETLNTPPIWGIARNDSAAYNVLYEKGALVLCELEEKVGRDNFFGFLREVSDRKIRTTDDLLSLAEVSFSKEIRSWLENKLRTQ